MSATKTAFAPRLVATTDSAEIADTVVRKIQTDRMSRKDSLAFWHRVTLATVRSDAPDSVSYTHLTLPTIYSV